MRPRSPLARVLLASAACAVCSAAAACLVENSGVPLDQPVFPTGMAVAGDRLLVVSSDFNLAEEEGALLSANLQTVREGTAEDGAKEVVEGAFDEAAVLPSFGDRPVVTSGAERVYVPTGKTNRVVAFDIAANGALSCPETTVDDPKQRPKPVAVCGENTSAMQLPVNDPFDVLILEETPPLAERLANPDDVQPLVRVDGIITMKSSPSVFFFSDDTRREAAQRLQVTSSLALPEIIGGIRSAVLRPAKNGTDPVVIAAADLSRDLRLFGARLALFFPAAGALEEGGELKTFDVTLVTGSLSMRDIVLVPGDDDDSDALVVVLREPDALARFEIDDVGGLPDLRLSAVAPTCKGPGALARTTLTGAAAPASGDVERVVLACHDGNVVEAIDPFTLRTTDAVRFEGRGPYDVVVHQAPDAGEGAGALEVFVSFFFDGSIGTMRFVDGKLEPTGRIGAADPRPEDGRE